MNIKIEELLSALNRKEEEKEKNTVLWVLAIIGAVAAVAGIAFAVYHFFAPDYLEDFKASPLPVPVIIAAISFIIGILTGLSQGHVAIVMPIVAALSPGDLNLAGVAMAFGVAGQMLTPTHMCFIVTLDYFKADFFKTLKPMFILEVMLLTVFSIYTWFTW